MIASVAAPAPPHQPSPSSSRPSRLRGLSLLRRSGQKSNPSSPPISPAERANLERNTGYPLNAPGASNTAAASSSTATGANEAAQFSTTDLGRTTSAGAAGASAGSAPSPSARNPTISSHNLAPESSQSSSGMARLRRAFSSQNGSQPAQSTANSGTVVPALPSAASATSPPATDSASRTGIEGNANGRDGLAPDQMPTIKFIPHQDPRASRPSLAFAATSRTLPHEDCVIRVGRYSERDGPQNPPPGVPSAAPVGFKSKVVSRKHCEFWCSQGQWYIKDIKSSSGTFLNHIRLSQPNMESRPFPVNDGDVVQLGIDFKGGEEAIFRCVKIRVECNRSWQKKLNDFNMNTHKRLRELNKTTVAKDGSSQTNECSICLMSIAPCQSLFVAPCSHVWHFKCIRPMLNDHKTYPQFLCPNCRAVTDLEADIEEIEWNQEVDEQQDTDPEGVATASTDGQQADDLDSPKEAPAGIPSSQADDAMGLAPQVASLEMGDTSNEGTSHSQSTPMQIPGSEQHLRPTTPGGGLAELTGTEGPLTPRNDAGPFVFDGSAGRAAPRPVVIGGLAQSLEAGEAVENLQTTNS